MPRRLVASKSHPHWSQVVFIPSFYHLRYDLCDLPAPIERNSMVTPLAALKTRLCQLSAPPQQKPARSDYSRQLRPLTRNTGTRTQTQKQCPPPWPASRNEGPPPPPHSRPGWGLAHTGWRRRCLARVASPAVFFVWHDEQIALRFSNSSLPPSNTGTT